MLNFLILSHNFCFTIQMSNGLLWDTKLLLVAGNGLLYSSLKSYWESLWESSNCVLSTVRFSIQDTMIWVPKEMLTAFRNFAWLNIDIIIIIKLLNASCIYKCEHNTNRIIKCSKSGTHCLWAIQPAKHSFSLTVYKINTPQGQKKSWLDRTLCLFVLFCFLSRRWMKGIKIRSIHFYSLIPKMFLICWGYENFGY